MLHQNGSLVSMNQLSQLGSLPSVVLVHYVIKYSVYAFKGWYSFFLQVSHSSLMRMWRWCLLQATHLQMCLFW